MSQWRGFASDNYAGVHPEIMSAMAAVNDGHEVAYGDDTVTAKLETLIKAHFGEAAQVFPVFNGTGANVIALQACLKRWEAVICADTAHIHADEGGAPEKMAGIKLWTVPTPDGKLTPDLVRSVHFGVGVVHHSQPKVVSITQSTEMGTVYTPDKALARGIVESVHAPEALLPSALARAEGLAALPQAAYETTKRRLRGAAVESVKATLDEEIEGFLKGFAQ